MSTSHWCLNCVYYVFIIVINLRPFPAAFSQIVHRYDLILIQEVRDNDLSATKKLMEQVNKSDPIPTSTQAKLSHIGK